MNKGVTMIFGVLSVLAAAVLVGVDQLIKRWATAVLLPKTAMTLIPGVLELRYFLNDGMAFSMLAGKQKLLIAVTSLMPSEPGASSGVPSMMWQAKFSITVVC